MPVDLYAAGLMRFCSAAAAMVLSENWQNAFFKYRAAGDDYVETDGETATIKPCEWLR